MELFGVTGVQQKKSIIIEKKTGPEIVVAC